MKYYDKVTSCGQKLRFWVPPRLDEISLSVYQSLDLADQTLKVLRKHGVPEHSELEVRGVVVTREIGKQDTIHWDILALCPWKNNATGFEVLTYGSLYLAPRQNLPRTPVIQPQPSSTVSTPATAPAVEPFYGPYGE